MPDASVLLAGVSGASNILCFAFVVDLMCRE